MMEFEQQERDGSARAKDCLHPISWSREKERLFDDSVSVFIYFLQQCAGKLQPKEFIDPLLITAM
jgi:hypothetical protein